MQFITGVGGFAAGLVTLSSFLLLGLSVREGEFGLAVRLLLPLALGVGHLVSLYGLVTLERWGYRWTRRLFAVTLVAVLPAATTGSPVVFGTIAFSAGVLVYLWLIETSVFTPSVPDASTLGEDAAESVEVDSFDHGEATTIDVDPLDRGDGPDESGQDEDGDDGGDDDTSEVPD